MTIEHPPRTFSLETLARYGFPTISYDELAIGEEFRSDDRLIRPQDIEAYAYAVQDHDPWFFEPGPFGGPIAHPTLLANQALFLRHNRYVVPVGLHARMVFEFVNATPLGCRARTTGRVVDKYLRRGKPYMVTEYRTADEGDRTLLRGRFVQMLFRHETAPAPGSSAADSGVAGDDSASISSSTRPGEPGIDDSVTSGAGRQGTIEVGQELPRITRTIEQRQIDIYSGVKPRSIHTDEAWAQAKGFASTIAQGMMSTAYVSAMMTSAIGTGFVEGGKMDVRFLRPVLRGDELTTSGTVIGFTSDGDEKRVLVEVAVGNQHGQQTLAGSASAVVERR